MIAHEAKAYQARIIGGHFAGGRTARLSSRRVVID
jgi:hypothetical protein